jgi:hypothetical protein
VSTSDTHPLLLPPSPSFRCTALACKQKYGERQYWGLLTVKPGVLTFAPAGTSAAYPLLDRFSTWLLNLTSGVEPNLGTVVHTQPTCALLRVPSGYYRSWLLVTGDSRYGDPSRVLVGLRTKHYVPDALRWAGFTVTEEQTTKDGLIDTVRDPGPAT